MQTLKGLSTMRRSNRKTREGDKMREPPQMTTTSTKTTMGTTMSSRRKNRKKVTKKRRKKSNLTKRSEDTHLKLSFTLGNAEAVQTFDA
jgi:hypothetical protein